MIAANTFKPRFRLVAPLLTWFALAIGGSTAGRAQVIVELAGLSCLEVRPAAPTFGQEYVARQPVKRESRALRRAAPTSPTGHGVVGANAVAATTAAPTPVAADSVPGGTEILDSIIRAITSGNIVLDNFGSTTRTGSVRTGTTWVGNVTQNADTITVGGLARNVNGWGVTGLTIDATGMNSIFVTAQRDTGHAAPSLFIQFEDVSVNTKVYSIDTSLFAVGALTTVQIPLSAWPNGFSPTQIAGWNIGGGGVGTVDFRMTFDHLEFSASAVPEPSAVALLAGLGVVGFALYRRRRS